MLFAWTGVCAETVDAAPLTLGETAEAVISNEGAYAYFSYTPETTGTYVWYSTASVDTYGYIYNASMHELMSDDDGGNDRNFRASTILVAGKTYYFVARYFSSDKTGSFNVTLEFEEAYEGQGLILVKAAESDSLVLLNSPATLEVIVESTDDNITYAWYTANGELIEGASSSTYTTGPVTERTSYRCRVTDAYENSREVWFSIHIDNQLTAEPVGSNQVRVPVEGTAELAVSASCLNGELTYEWHRQWQNDSGWQDETVADAASDSITTIPVTDQMNYYCRVTDIYGNSRDVSFYISIDNQLTVNPVGTTEPAANVGETVTLAVDASCLNGELTYQWYREWEETDGWHDEEIADATTNSVTTAPVTGRIRYYCRVSDIYGGSREVWYYIRIENEFTAEAVGTTEPTVSLGDTVELAVAASCRDGGLTYQWYQQWEDEDGWHEVQIENATSATMTTESITRRMSYYCHVADIYGSNKNVWFYVGIENQFRASAVGTTEPVAVLGGTVDLAVTASCLNGEITYQWYREWEDENGYHEERIENAVSDSITTDPITQRMEYYCRVSDMYGNNRNIWFYVGVDNQLTVNPVGNTEPMVVSGSTVELAVTASCANGDLSYQWYQGWRNGNDWNFESIPGATSDSYTTPQIENRMRYYCSVVDMYGNRDDVWFTVGIENQLTANAVGTTSPIVPIGGTAELAVTASCRDGALNYQWYREWRVDDSWRSEIVPGATSASVTTAPLSRAMEYYCRVTDMYGNERNVWFQVAIDNQFSARAVGNTRPKVPAGNTTALEVLASCAEGELTYEWYKVTHNSQGEWQGETRLSSSGNTQTTDPVTQYTEYYCCVSDDYGNSRNIWFYIGVDNQLRINWDEMTDYVEVAPGETAVLSVSASCASGELSYQWYKNVQIDGSGWIDQIIPGATSSTYTTEAISTNVQYFCRVSDMYDNYERVWMTVAVDNQLKVWAESAQSISVAQGERVVLSADASCAAGNLRYQWSRKKYYNDGGWNYEAISGATGKTLTIESVTEGAEYSFSATDEYNNSESIEFRVGIENGLKVAWNSNPEVDYDGSVTLEVDAVCASGDLTYVWAVDYQTVTSATGPTYTLTHVTDYIEVICLVIDRYGNTEQCYFYPEIRDEISIDASVSINGKAPEKRFGAFYINSGDSAVVSVTATSSLGSDISYSWYLNDESVTVDNNTLSLPSITGFTSVRCEVVIEKEDGNTEYYQRYYYFILENHLKAEPVGTRIRRINAGEQVTLEVDASADSGSLTYIWTDRKDQKLGDQKALKVTPEATAYYYCEVKDQYGMSVYCDFTVVVGSSNNLVLDTPLKIQTTGSGDLLYYFYTPSANGIYTLCSSGSLYPNAYLYNMNGELLANVGSRSENNNNFVLSYLLEAGTTYVYRVRCWDSGTLTITLKRDEDTTVPTGVYMLRKGQTVRLPFTDVSSVSSDTPAILSVSGNSVSALQNGTGILKVNWSSGASSTYRFIVNSGSVMTMPGALRTIESEAFAGDKALRFVELSAQTQSVGMFAFQNSSLAQIIIPGTGTKLATSALYGIQPTVLCKEGSEAEKWCVNNNQRYLYID